MVSAVSYTRLTLALDIVRKLSGGPYSGYHELGLIKQKISLGDTITISESDEMLMTCNHDGVPLDNSNICWKAVDLIRLECGLGCSVSVDIQKVIPVQGGLAGGSTNAATVITLLDELWRIGLTYDDKVRLGRKLGMDVPFYFTGGSAFDSEATEVLEPFAHTMKLFFLLVVPPFGVSTSDAYRGINYGLVGSRQNETKRIKSVLQQGNYEELAGLLHNDFELSVFPQYPSLVDIRDKIIECGADASFMSGSGSTMVGMFSSIDKIRDSAGLFSSSMVVESI